MKPKPITMKSLLHRIEALEQAAKQAAADAGGGNASSAGGVDSTAGTTSAPPPAHTTAETDAPPLYGWRFYKSRLGNIRAYKCHCYYGNNGLSWDYTCITETTAGTRLSDSEALAFVKDHTFTPDRRVGWTVATAQEGDRFEHEWGVDQWVECVVGKAGIQSGYGTASRDDFKHSRIRNVRLAGTTPAVKPEPVDEYAGWVVWKDSGTRIGNPSYLKIARGDAAWESQDKGLTWGYGIPGTVPYNCIELHGHEKDAVVRQFLASEAGKKYAKPVDKYPGVRVFRYENETRVYGRFIPNIPGTHGEWWELDEWKYLGTCGSIGEIVAEGHRELHDPERTEWLDAHPLPSEEKAANATTPAELEEVANRLEHKAERLRGIAAGLLSPFNATKAAEVVDELERLRAIVAKLPKTGERTKREKEDWDALRRLWLWHQQSNPCKPTKKARKK